MPTNVLASFVSALADGGSVCWDTTPVRVRLAPKWAHTFQQQPEDVRGELREVLRRAAAFHQQVQDSAGTHVVPYLVLPGAPTSSLITNSDWRPLPLLIRGTAPRPRARRPSWGPAIIST